MLKTNCVYGRDIFKKRSAELFARHYLFIYILALLLSVSSPAFAREPLNFWHVSNYDEVVCLRQVAERFEEQTGITVHIQPVPWGNFRTKYLTAMAAGQPPDAGTISLGGAKEYGKVGGLLDLAEAYPEATARLKAKTFPDMWHACYFRKHLFAAPFDAMALIGFYRKDLFADMGLEPPRTWSELDHVLQKIAAEGQSYGFLFTRDAYWGLGTFSWPFDTDAYTPDGLEVNWLDPDFQKGYQYAIHMWNGFHLFTEKPVEIFSHKDKSKASPLFFDQHSRYAEIMYRAPYIRDDFGILPFPHPDDGKAATMMGGRYIAIFRDGKHPDEAMQWIEFILSKESQLFIYEFMRNLGERSGLALSVNREVWEEDLGLLPGHQAAFLEIYEGLNTRENVPWLDEANRNLEQSLFQMRDITLQFFKDGAGQHDMSIHDYKSALWRGELPEEEQAYRTMLKEGSARTLGDLAPGAQEKLDKDRATYEQFFGQYLDSGITSKLSWDVLNTAELLIALIVLAAAVFVLMNRQTKPHITSYIFISLPLLSAMLFIGIPILVSLYLSFTKYNPVMPLSGAHWVGLENYTEMLQDKVLWQSLGRSLYYVALVLPSQMIIAVILASCLDKKLWPDRLYKFMYFSPLVTSIVSVSLIWFALYVGQRHGWINSMLLGAHLTRDPIYFLKDTGTFLNCVIIMSIWQGLAFTILIFLAGLQNVPNQQYEAASIDGAGSIRQFLHISLPALKPQFSFLLIMGSIGAVQVFEQIFMLGGGAGEAESKFGPDDSGMTIVPFIYRKGFEFFKMGEASAVAFILFILLFIVTFFNLRMSMKKAN
jgi:multiple sugar transport system permease protein